MRCDGDAHCTIDPMRAPRLIVPHKFQIGDPLRSPRRVMTPFHYCELHRQAVDEAKLVNALLTPQVIRDVETVAKVKWPLGYKCDFDRAHIEWVLVTTPEYRAFMAALGYHGVMGAAKIAPEQQQKLRSQLGVVRMAGSA